MAFLLCVAFSVKGGMRRLWYCVAHTLTGRYVLGAINIMDHRIDIDEIEASLVTQISDYWGSAADDFCTSESTNIPFQRFVLEFSLYRYSVVRVNFERNSLFFSEVSKGISFNLLSRKVSYPDLIDTLAEIDEEVRLRIPDKYLVAKGWQRT
ncbi:hypothetical protein [Vibrio harveyi]|uniref:hypothetical protein n=2 Tax=Vibrio harveyi TaxID=669 RepID=UPI0028C4244D|nr:hypothetical protein [Vibrio harveyi]